MSKSMAEMHRMVDDCIHPCPSNIRAAMDMLEAEATKAGALLAMSNVNVVQNECGTSACLGGSYVQAINEAIKLEERGAPQPKGWN